MDFRHRSYLYQCTYVLPDLLSSDKFERMLSRQKSVKETLKKKTGVEEKERGQLKMMGRCVKLPHLATL